MTAPGTCETCTYCEQEPNAKTAIVGDPWTCTHKMVNHCTRPAMPAQDGITVEYDEGWGLLVGPDFGCVHYEKD